MEDYLLTFPCCASCFNLQAASLGMLNVTRTLFHGSTFFKISFLLSVNERTQLIFRTAGDTVEPPNLSLIDSGGGTNDYGSPGPTNVQSTRKNIAEYLRQGAGASIFDSFNLNCKYSKLS
jgi:hypothetical protein